nr:hypothetical protein [Polyangium spumosum]
MVDERHSKQVRGFLHAPGESDVLGRGVRIPARVVVDQDEPGRGELEAGPKDVGRPNGERVEAASCDEASSAKAALTAEREEVQLLVREQTNPGMGPYGDIVARTDCRNMNCIDQAAAAKFKSGGYARSLVQGEAEALS